MGIASVCIQIYDAIRHGPMGHTLQSAPSGVLFSFLAACGEVSTCKISFEWQADCSRKFAKRLYRVQRENSPVD